MHLFLFITLSLVYIVSFVCVACLLCFGAYGVFSTINAVFLYHPRPCYLWKPTFCAPVYLVHFIPHHLLCWHKSWFGLNSFNLLQQGLHGLRNCLKNKTLFPQVIQIHEQLVVFINICVPYFVCTNMFTTKSNPGMIILSCSTWC